MANDKCTTSASELMESVLDVSQYLYDGAQSSPLFDPVIIADIKGVTARAPSRLKEYLYSLCNISEQLIKLVANVETTVTHVVHNASNDGISSNNVLTNAIVTRFYLYEHDKNLVDTCKIIGQGRSITELYNTKILGLIEDLKNDLIGGIDKIEIQLTSIKDQVIDPAKWSESDTEEETENHIKTVQELEEEIEAFVASIEPRTNTVLDLFATQVKKIAQQTEKSFSDVVSNLMALQASHEAMTPGLDKNRPSIVETPNPI